MSRIFLSHSSADNAPAVALRDWLRREGWDDVFLDVDPDRGIAAGERWERALNEAASRCEAVLFLVSRDWLGSGWCQKEFNLAHRLNKRIFGVLIEEIDVAELPFNLTSTWQLVRLGSGTDHVMFHVLMPFSGQEAHVTFSAGGLGRLRSGLQRAGLDPDFFAWPPSDDKNRRPYPGLRPLEADDAGIFFGREAAIVETLDTLRGLREGGPPRLLVILGASGAGKSSFLRAGILPRLTRDDDLFFPLPVIRPERAPITGETGLLRALEGGFASAGMPMARAELRLAVEGGAAGLAPLLQRLAKEVTPPGGSEARRSAPALVLAIDQGEELFAAEAHAEAGKLLALLAALLGHDDPAVVVIFTIRSDNYERLQVAEEFEGLRQTTLSLSAMPRGSYSEIIRGPARRLDGTQRALKIDDGLVDALLADIEADGGAKDALPLLAFTLERLYDEYHAKGMLNRTQYGELGGVKGSIEVAVKRAFDHADKDPTITRDHDEQLELLRRGLIPWLAGVDPDTGTPRRRVARLTEIPETSRALVGCFIEQRLLTTDAIAGTGEQTVEPAHEALLRQWGRLQRWLAEDADLLSVMDGVKRAARDWVGNGRTAHGLIHGTSRLEAAQRLDQRPDLAALLAPDDGAYLKACAAAEAKAKWRRRSLQAVIYTLLVGIITGLVGWMNQAAIKSEVNWYVTERPYMEHEVRPHVLSAAAVAALKPKDTFHECAKDCPEMVVLPPGPFTMGSPVSEEGESRLNDDERPQHLVTISKAFAVSEYDVTFEDWDACAAVGGCPPADDSGFGRGKRPVINVTWEEARQYAAWLALMTGQPYRLLTEAEWEYAARAGTQTAYYWGPKIGAGNADCNGCGSQWDNGMTAPVGSFKPNGFGLYDMAGDVWQWTQDCYHKSYEGAPSDGFAVLNGDCSRRTRRGGGWGYNPPILRSANRGADSPVNRSAFVGFRIARSLDR